MENKSNRSDDSLKKEIENKNIIVKNITNYYSKQFLTYIGSKNHTFFFYSTNHFFQQKRIYIQQQFSLNRQSKVIKKWRVDFRKIALMNKSHEIIALCNYEINQWKIDSCYNLTKRTSFTFHVKLLNDSDDDFFQLQLGTKDDWIVASQHRNILFLQKGMEGEWKLIHTMKTHFLKFKLNESGNILIILLQEGLCTDDQLYLTIYIKNNFGEWRIGKKMDHCYYCFLENEQFVDMSNNIITVQQVNPEKFEVVQLQQIKLGLEKGEILEGINYIKQNQLLIAQTRFAIYFLKKQNEKFYFAQQIEIQNELLFAGSEGLLFNIFGVYRIPPFKIEIFKIHEN